MIIKKEVQNYLYSRNYNDMKIKIKRNKTNNEDNLLPLVNIIFLLLILSDLIIFHQRGELYLISCFYLAELKLYLIYLLSHFYLLQLLYSYP